MDHAFKEVKFGADNYHTFSQKSLTSCRSLLVYTYSLSFVYHTKF